MNLKQLKVFQAVADNGSFSKGAEASFITQSTVSQHIAALEAEFGVRLLDRTGKGVLLTEGGKVLLQHARGLLAELHAIEQVMLRFKGVEAADLNVGCSNIPGVYMIPTVLNRLLLRHPGLAVTLIQGGSRDILARLAGNEMEIAVVGGCFAEAALEFTPLGSDQIRLVAGIGHPWATRGSVALSELLQEPVVLREPGSGTGTTVNEALLAAGINPRQLKVAVNLGSNEAVKLAVSNGLGVAFVSEISVRKELERRELALVGLEGLSISRRFYLASRSGRDLSPAARAFAEVMLETFDESGGVQPTGAGPLLQ